MALDSQTKRMAAAGVGRPYMRATFPNSLLTSQRPSIGLSYPVRAITPVETANRHIAYAPSLREQLLREDEELMVIIQGFLHCR